MCTTAVRRWLWFVIAVVSLLPLISAAHAETDSDVWDAAHTKLLARDFTSAEGLYAKLAKQFPSSPKAPEALLRLAYIKVKNEPKATQDIINIFARIREEYPGSSQAAEALVRIGYLHTKSDAQQAIKDFTEFVDLHPNHRLTPGAQQSLGRLFLRSKDWDKAQAAFDKVCAGKNVPASVAEEAALQSAFVNTHRYLSTQDKTFLEATIRALSKCQSVTKSSVRARAELGTGEALLFLGNFKESRAKYEAAAASGACSAKPYYRGLASLGAGMACQGTGDYEGAARNFGAVLSSVSGSTLAERDSAWKKAAAAVHPVTVRARIENQNGAFPGSEAVIQSALNQGASLFWLKRYDEARTVLSELSQLPQASSAARSRALDLVKRCDDMKGGK